MSRTKKVPPTKKSKVGVSKKATVKKVESQSETKLAPLETSIKESTPLEVSAERQASSEKKIQKDVIASLQKSTIIKNSGACKSGKVLIANHHTAPIVIPRSSGIAPNKITLTPLNLKPGEITPVDAEEWAIRKKNRVIGYYLDKGLLAEISNLQIAQNIPTYPRTSSPEIPEHLSTDDDKMIGKTGIPSAQIKRQEVGSIPIQ